MICIFTTMPKRVWSGRYFWIDFMWLIRWHHFCHHGKTVIFRKSEITNILLNSMKVYGNFLSTLLKTFPPHTIVPYPSRYEIGKCVFSRIWQKSDTSGFILCPPLILRYSTEQVVSRIRKLDKNHTNFIKNHTNQVRKNWEEK